MKNNRSKSVAASNRLGLTKKERKQIVEGEPIRRIVQIGKTVLVVTLTGEPI
jgi:hypothetical protein